MPVLYIRDENGNFVPLKTIKGEPGKTPVRGEDYWTADDQQQIIEDVLSRVGTGGGSEGGGESSGGGGGTISAIECIYTVTEDDVAAGKINLNLGTIGEKTIYRVTGVYFDEGKGGGSTITKADVILPQETTAQGRNHRSIIAYTGAYQVKNWGRYAFEYVLTHDSYTLYTVFNETDAGRWGLAANKTWVDSNQFAVGNLFVRFEGTFVAGINIYIRAEVLN